MGELFQTSKQIIAKHLKAIFLDGGLCQKSVVIHWLTTAEESSVVQIEGSRQVQRPLTLYNLDAILAVGYRVRSPRGVQFRRWANTV